MLAINPRVFEFVYDEESSMDVHVKNVSDDFLAFKVKTTKRERFLVKPNHGMLKPREETNIKVAVSKKHVPSRGDKSEKFQFDFVAISAEKYDEVNMIEDKRPQAVKNLISSKEKCDIHKIRIESVYVPRVASIEGNISREENSKSDSKSDLSDTNVSLQPQLHQESEDFEVGIQLRKERDEAICELRRLASKLSKIEEDNTDLNTRCDDLLCQKEQQEATINSLQEELDSLRTKPSKSNANMGYILGLALLLVLVMWAFFIGN